MAETVIQKILERIDESETPRDLDRRDIGDCPEADVDQLVDRGILLRETFSAAGYVTTEFSEDGTMRPKTHASRPEPFYRIVIPRVLDAISEDNALRGRRRSFKNRLFELGAKRFRDLPPIRVCLSLRNEDIDWFDRACGRVGRDPKNPAVLLVPRWVPISGDLQKKNDMLGVTVIFLSECLKPNSWELPWDELRHEVRTSVSTAMSALPGEPFSTPPGTRWCDVTITVGDFDVMVDVKGTAQSYTFGDAGFENKRSKAKPNIYWGLLRNFGTRGGVIATRDDLLERPTQHKLKHYVSVLRKRIKDLVPGVGGDPIPFDRFRHRYRTAFRVRSREPVRFPTPAETRWSDVDITEIEPAVFRISVPSTQTYAVSSYEEHGGFRHKRPEPAQEGMSVTRDFDLRHLGLIDESDQLTPAAEALLAVLRNGGRVERSAKDEGMLALGRVLCDVMGLESPAFSFSDQGSVWRAEFSASSDVGGSG